VALHIPTWSHSPFLPNDKGYNHVPPSEASGGSGTSARTISFSTGPVKNNGFNPMWQEELCLPFDCVGEMKDLIFVEFIVKQDKKPDYEPLASYIAPLSSLRHGEWTWCYIFLFAHLPCFVQASDTFLCTTHNFVNTCFRRFLCILIFGMLPRHHLCSSKILVKDYLFSKPEILFQNEVTSGKSV
jgi:hypothetical protein